MDDRTRDSGSFSNLSDSGRRAAARLGQRRWSTVERPRLGASVDGEARQKTALLTVRPRRRTRRRSSVPSRTRCRTPLIGVAGDDMSVQLNVGHRTTAHSTRLEALHGRPSRALFRTSLLFEVNSRTARTVNDNSPARNSRAHANCFELSRTRMFLREKTTSHRRNTDCSVAREQNRWTDDVRGSAHRC